MGKIFLVPFYDNTSSNFLFITGIYQAKIFEIEIKIARAYFMHPVKKGKNRYKNLLPKAENIHVSCFKSFWIWESKYKKAQVRLQY